MDKTRVYIAIITIIIAVSVSYATTFIKIGEFKSRIINLEKQAKKTEKKLDTIQDTVTLINLAVMEIKTNTKNYKEIQDEIKTSLKKINNNN